MSHVEMQKPLCIAIPGYESAERVRYLWLRSDRVIADQNRLEQIHEAAPDGRGGLIAPAQAMNGAWGYLNELGEWIVEPTLDEARTFGVEGISRFKKNGLWGYLDIAGKVLIEPQYEDCTPFECGRAAVLVAANQWRYINRDGQFAFEGTFLRAQRYSSIGLAPATKTQKDGVGYLNVQGEWAIAPQFRVAKAFGAEGVAPASLDGDLYGLIDRNGHWVLEPKHPNIEAFNEDSLAYFDFENSWDNGHGYVNAKGEIAVKGDRHLSNVMRSGIASADYNGSRYLTKFNKPLTDRYFPFGSHFNTHGFAIVRTPSSVWSEEKQARVKATAEWGLLRDDGTFLSLPGEILEPLTDADGWLVYARSDTPLAPFLTKTGDVVYIDRSAKIAYRVRYETIGETTHARLYDAAGNSIWASDADESFHAPKPFFECDIDAYLDRLGSVHHAAAFADTMLAETEDKLHRFAQGDDLEDESGESDDSDDDDDDDELLEPEDRVVTKRRLVRAYVSEEHNGYYDFLSSVQAETVERARSVIEAQLIERFGESDPDPEAKALQNLYSDWTRAWKVSLKRPVRDSDSRLPETRDLWIAFYAHSDSGDGDVWHELWMTCAPSVDAIDLARRERTSGTTGVGATEHDEKDEAVQSDTSKKKPETYEEWLAFVRENDWNITGVPRAMLDEPMINAAIEADARAFSHLPSELQTEERLASLIRRDVASAREIPAKCMTKAGLELARSLYGEDDHWRWHDDRKSKRPKKWDKNSLYDIWGALVTEDDCVLAMKGGESLDSVSRWLRSERVEKTALDADIYNISYIDREKITPELALRAVRHDYGKLIEHIPARLITHDLCLTSAAVNGLSLEHIPEAFRTIDVCVAAMKDDPRCFAFVPLDISIDVCDRLITEKQKKEKLDAEAVTRWHSYRAWARLWRKEYEFAIADATIALRDENYYAAHAYYVRASAYRALGDRRQAAMEAASVLSIVGDDNDYQAEFDEKESTSWLREFANAATRELDNADDETLIENLKTHPLALENVPRERVTREMIDIAIAANPNAVQFVPKRLMTPALYALSVRERHKRFSNVPEAMLSEEACIDEVRGGGYALARIPVQWRTARVCAEALHDTEKAIEYVPENVRAEAIELAKSMPRDEDENENTSSRAGAWITSKIVDQVVGEETKLKRAKFTGLILLLGLGAKSDSPPTLPGVLGWLEQRPFAAMMLNALLALIAVVCHVFVTVKAWQLEGALVGIATAVFMGLAEFYWLWRFFANDPTHIGYGIAALIVLLYVFGYRWIHKKVVLAIAAKHSDAS